jgi:hypothetical protein|tara:strand:+ start:2743 stop:3237 length:495 start_codon:yes stop_codon:yes gene_type:complete
MERVIVDPFTAIAAATTAFNTVKKFVQAGQDFENTVGQMGKWYTAISDFRKGQQMQKKPPLFKKLFNAGSVEEEALALLMHEKKILEQEKELQALLNFRYGYGTWDELKEMRRKIKDQREKAVYKQAQMRADFIETAQIGTAVLVLLAIVGGFLYWIFKSKGII